MQADDSQNGSYTAPVDWWNLPEVLTYFVHNAILILEEYGAELKEFKVKPESIEDLSDSDRDRARSATRVLLWASQVHHWVGKGDCENAVLNTMQLSRAVVELMPMRGQAIRAQKSQRGLDMGSATLQSERKKKRDLCRDIAQGILNRDSSLSA